MNGFVVEVSQLRRKWKFLQKIKNFYLQLKFSFEFNHVTECNYVMNVLFHYEVFQVNFVQEIHYQILYDLGLPGRFLYFRALLDLKQLIQSHV